MSASMPEHHAPAPPPQLMERMMPQYRKKPVVVSAKQWFGPGDCPAWATHAVLEHECGFLIKTKEGQMSGNPGDWIIQGVEGEVYPCAPLIFEKTYEPVE